MTIGTGLAGLLNFIKMLDDKSITYQLNCYEPESICVSYTLVECRVEVSFYEDHFEFSYFTGDEDVFRDEGKLMGLFDTYWS